MELVGDAENGEQLCALVKEVLPDVVFLDIRMPVMDGVTACSVLKKKYPDIKIVTLSMADNDYMIIDMLEAGADGYVLKNTNKKEILDAAKAVYEGKNYYCSNTSLKMAKLIASNRLHPQRRPTKKSIKLSSREKAVIKLICDQLTNKEIADNLQLSSRTIETYRQVLQQKTDSVNSIGIAIFALRTGIYPV